MTWMPCLIYCPTKSRKGFKQQPDISELVEVVMDLGRPPEARYFNREMVIVPQDLPTWIWNM